MKSCEICKKSYLVPTDDFGTSILVCCPEPDCEVQYAKVPCGGYVGPDEVLPKEQGGPGWVGVV